MSSLQVKSRKALDEENQQPIEKIRWMWESQNGWEVYSPEISREMELAKRAGKPEHTLRLGDRTLVCKFKGDAGEPVQEVNDEKWRLRVSLCVCVCVFVTAVISMFKRILCP